MKPNSAWHANSQRIKILMMSVISGHVLKIPSIIRKLVRNSIQDIMITLVFKFLWSYDRLKTCFRTSAQDICAIFALFSHLRVEIT